MDKWFKALYFGQVQYQGSSVWIQLWLVYFSVQLNNDTGVWHKSVEPTLNKQCPASVVEVDGISVSTVVQPVLQMFGDSKRFFLFRINISVQDIKEHTKNYKCTLK